MIVTQLSKIAKERGVKHGKLKKDLIQNLLKDQQISQTDVICAKKSLESATSSQTPLHHEYYRRNFNAIDLIDKAWYSLQNHHTIQEWESKYIISVLQLGILNSWTLFKFFENVSLLEFYEKLAKDLLDPNWKF